MFPRQTKEGCAILYHKVRDTSPWHYHMEAAMKVHLMCIELAVHNYPPPTGLIFLFDMKGVSVIQK